MAAEVVGAIIPNQRLDRIECLLRELEVRLTDTSRDEVEERFRNPEFVDLLEDGMQQASRALNYERIAHIAALLTNALTDDELMRHQDKRLLSLLGELNEVELILLASYTLRNGQDHDFAERHRSTLQRPPAVIGAPQNVIDAAAVHDEYRHHLVRLGLLRPRFAKPKRGELPQFDDRTGMVKASGHEMTALGRLLLRRIDLLSTGEF
jgi:hypothetical protein